MMFRTRRARIVGLAGCLILVIGIWLVLKPDRSSAQEYQNTELGFSLKFPASWDGYQLTEVATSEYHYVAFTQGDPKGTKVEFSIVKTDKENAKVPDNARFISGTYQQKYYAVESSSGDLKDLQPQAKAVDSILSTFKVLKE